MAGFTMLAVALLAGVRSGQTSKLPALAVPVLTQASPDMFPVSWRERDVRARAQSLEREEVLRSMDALSAGMDKYPQWLIRRNIRRVFVMRSLNFYGLAYGGTNSLDTLYLANKGREYGFSNRYLEESFHHEFSSVLLRNYSSRFEKAGWLKANAPGFRYLGDGTTAVKNGLAGTEYAAEWHRLGLLCEYGAASVEEDFNTFAEGLFAGGKSFWRVVDSYPRVKEKARAAIRFYQSLDAEFTEETFRAYGELLVTSTEEELRHSG